jgi:DNA-binding NarL/FixJ family response regulator
MALERDLLLSRRQQQVLELLKAGCGEKQIAAHLRISHQTVHVYVKALHKRFKVHTRGELLSAFIR